MQAVDYPIFRAINHGPEAFSSTMLFFSQALNIGWVKVGLLLLIVGMLAMGRKYRPASLLAILSVAIANPITDLAKHFAPMLRPFKDDGIASDVILRIGSFRDDVGFGTASAHSANMAAVATAMWLVLGWRWGLPWAFIAVMTGISRVYNGVHFPSQVALGWVIGAGAGVGVVAVTRYFIPALRQEKMKSSDMTVEPSRRT